MLNCELKTGLGNIVSHHRKHSNYRQIIKKVFYNVTFNCFQNQCHLLKSQKKNKNVFQSELEVLLCFEMNHKFLERHKKPLSLAATGTRKSCEHGPENGKHCNKNQTQLTLV